VKNSSVIAGALLLMLSGSIASADECPELSAAVLDKIQEMGNADPDILVAAKIMHDEAMGLHESGDHDGSIEKLNSAMELLATGE